MAKIPDSLSITINAVAPHFEQYFGVWAMEESRFSSFAQVVHGLDLSAHLAANQPDAEARAEAGRDYEIKAGGIAVVEISGPLMKHSSSLAAGTSTVLARRQIRAAAADEEINAIVLRIDSPGGTVAGTQEIADAVSEAAKTKPVHAFIEDLGASAAYWIASQANKIFANPTALVGSIGTFAVIHDQSEFAKNEGIKVHVIRAGEFKGAGVAGTVVTDDQLSNSQKIVDELNSHFLRAVASGRGLSQAAVGQLADGRVHLSEPAVGLKLIDGVQSFDETLNNLRRGESASGRMAKTNTEAVSKSKGLKIMDAASYAEIVAACNGIDAKNGDDAVFVASQLSKGADVATAQSNWMAELKLRADVATEATAKAEKEKADAEEKAKSKESIGVDALEDESTDNKSSDSGSAVERFNEAVAAKEKAGLSKVRAISSVAKSDPDLHADYIREFNEARGRNVA